MSTPLQKNNYFKFVHIIFHSPPSCHIHMFKPRKGWKTELLVLEIEVRADTATCSNEKTKILQKHYFGIKDEIYLDGVNSNNNFSGNFSNCYNFERL